MVMEIQIHRCPEPSCSFFNQVLPHNAKICPMCGSPLGQTLQSPVRVASPAHYSQPSATISQPSSASSNQARPQLKFFHPSERSFLLMRESGVIGRQNLKNGMRPEIDLTNLPNAGVISRVHAHIYWDSEQRAYMIVDDSRNGSYLNGELLARGAPHPLNQGDKLQLGQDRLICLQVELSHNLT
jgi:pSer/pThr/pTyr-binding forkhead associated (FHA) protein